MKPSSEDDLIETVADKGDNDVKRTRLLSGVARQAFKLRAELVDLTLDRGGLRQAWLCGRNNLQKRYLIQISGCNLGPIVCPL